MKQKRILQFPGTMLFGGVGSVVMNLYRNIDNNCVQFDFCVPRDDVGPMDAEILQTGGRLFYVPQMRKVGIRAYVRAITKILKEEGPFDAVHVHSVHMGAIILLAAKLAGVKNRIYHVHNTQDAALDSMTFHIVIEWLLKKLILLLATKRYACGMDAGRYIYGFHTFEVVNNAIDMSRFHPVASEEKKLIKERIGVPNDKIVVGNIARFVKEKNQRFFIDLALQDKKNKNQLFFLLVGDGDERCAIEDLVKKYYLEDSFMFTGNRRDMEQIYHAMDVFCLPSLFEGLPVTVMEAQACGIPCFVATSVTVEANIGAVPYVSFSLRQDVSSLIDSIFSLAQKDKPTLSHVANVFAANSYEIKTVAFKLQNYYMSINE